MRTASRASALVCLGLFLSGVVPPAAVAQFERYACGIDDEDSSTDHRTETDVRPAAAATGDKRSGAARKQGVRRGSESAEADNVLLMSAEAVRAKLRSDKTRISPARYHMAAAAAEPKERPSLLDSTIRHGKFWRSLPKINPWPRMFNHDQDRAAQAANVDTPGNDAGVASAAHHEPVEQPATADRRGVRLSRHMTPEELAEYVKQRRARPWWRRGR
jgi:hypothetical protein